MKNSLSMAAGALGTLTGLVFEKREKILQNVTWLKAFKEVNFHQHSNSNYTLSRGFFCSLGSLITLPKSDWQNLTPYY